MLRYIFNVYLAVQLFLSTSVYYYLLSSAEVYLNHLRDASYRVCTAVLLLLCYTMCSLYT